MLFGPAGEVTWDVGLGRQPRLELTMNSDGPTRVTVRAEGAGHSEEVTCQAERSSTWQVCRMDLQSFSGAGATITLQAASAAIADPVIYSVETGDRATDLGSYRFEISSSLVPVRFTPDKVRSGLDSYVIEIPEMAGATIDLLVRYRGGRLQQSKRFRTLDEHGRATVAVPAGLSPGVFEVAAVRRSGDREWRAATGRVEIVE